MFTAILSFGVLPTEYAEGTYSEPHPLRFRGPNSWRTCLSRRWRSHGVR